jgi:AbrB family looped-hinge helix DNA binding protein
MNTSTVSAKGWVVIPAELRGRYGLKKGDKVRFVEYGGVIAVIPALKHPVKESAGMLKGEGILLEALTKSRREEAGRGR